MGIWEAIQKEIVDKPEISAELRTSWREQESMVLTLENTKTKQKTERGFCTEEGGTEERMKDIVREMLLRLDMEQNRDENEKKKEYLKRYHSAVLAEKAIQQEIDELRMDKMYPMLIQDGMPHGSSCGDLSEYAAQLDGLLADLKEQMEKRISIRREITQKIEQMQDETEKMVLRLRYIHWLRWEQIAERMGYGWAQVHRIHGKALANFKMK